MKKTFRLYKNWDLLKIWLWHILLTVLAVGINIVRTRRIMAQEYHGSDIGGAVGFIIFFGLVGWIVWLIINRTQNRQVTIYDKCLFPGKGNQYDHQVVELLKVTRITVSMRQLWIEDSTQGKMGIPLYTAVEEPACYREFFDELRTYLPMDQIQMDAKARAYLDPDCTEKPSLYYPAEVSNLKGWLLLLVVSLAIMIMSYGMTMTFSVMTIREGFADWALTSLLLVINAAIIVFFAIKALIPSINCQRRALPALKKLYKVVLILSIVSAVYNVIPGVIGGIEHWSMIALGPLVSIPMAYVSYRLYTGYLNTSRRVKDTFVRE